MHSYSYKAVAKSGKTVKASLDAPSLENAKNSLRAAGYSILEINELNALNKDIELPFLGNPTAKDMAVFCRQFQSILRAGVPVVQVLVMLGQQTENKKLNAAIRDMQASIEKGETLAGSMRKHPKIFSGMLINMVAAGEESGNLEESFHQMDYICPADGFPYYLLVQTGEHVTVGFDKMLEDGDSEMYQGIIRLGTIPVGVFAGQKPDLHPFP